MARGTRNRRGLSAGSAVRTTAASQLQPPVAYTPPSLTGNVGVGQVLTVNKGIYSGSPASLRTEVLRNGVVIPGTTNVATYTQTADDAGAVLCAGERVLNSKGYVTARGPASPVVPSSGSTPVPAVPVVNPPAGGVSPLSISGASGTANVGDTASFTPAISGGTAPYTVAATGLPPGRAINNAATGLTTGAYTTAGIYANIVYTVTDATGATATLTRSVVVSATAYAGLAIGTYAENNDGSVRSFTEWLGVVPTGFFSDSHGGRGDYNPAGTFAGEVSDWESADYPLTANGWIGAGHELRIAIPMFPKSGNFTDALAGNYDASITTIATKIKNALDATQSEFHIRFGWEQNGNFQPWGIVTGSAVDATKAANYAAWWRRARARFLAVSPKFKMNFCVNLGSFDYRASWPGDDQVEYIGMDVYPAIGDANYRAPAVVTDAMQTALWNTTRTRSFGTDDIIAFAAQKGKPLTIPEVGIEFDNGQVFMDLFCSSMAAAKAKDIGLWNANAGGVNSIVSNGNIPGTGAYIRSRWNPIGYPARASIAPALNWRLAITGAVTDSAGDATTQTAVQNSSTNKKHALVSLAINQTRVLTIPIAAIVAPGAFVYLNVDRAVDQVYSLDSLVGSTVERSTDGGTTWSTISLTQGDTLDRGRGYLLPAGAASLLRVTLANTGAGAVAMSGYFGVFQLPASGRIDSWGIWGASFQAFGAHPRRYTNALQTANPGRDPIVFNRGVSGTTTKLISDRVIAELPTFPYISYAYINQGGNTLGPLARPLVPVNGDLASIKVDATAMINAVKNAGVVPVVSDISYRDLGPTYVADNTAPQNGPFPVNRDVLYPMFTTLLPDMIDPITGVTRANEFGLFMYLRDSILSQGDQHPSDGYVAVNGMQAGFFGAYAYGTAWPKSIYETAVAAFETAKTVATKNAAYELVQSLPGNTAQAAFTKAAFQRRLAAFTVALPAMTVNPTISGTAQVGQILTLTFGTASNLPLALNWTLRRDDNSVAASGIAPRRGLQPDGTSYVSTPYTAVSADGGHTLRLEVAPVNGQGAGTLVSSAATAAVAASGTAPTLGTLSLSPNTATAGTAYNGTLSGATSGSSITVGSLTVTGTGATRTVTGTPSAAGNLDAVENLAGATGSPKTTTGVLAVAAAGGTGRTAQAHINLSTGAGVPNWTDVDVSAALSTATAVALPDTTGAATGWKIYKFSGSAPTYQSFAVPPAPKAYPDGVYAGIYGSKGSPFVMRLTGLNPAKTYKIEELGNRGAGGTGRITDYTVNGVTITQDNADNGNRIATFTGVVPTAGGTLDLTCDANTASTSFWYLNTIVVTESP